jgi:mono/diheme cytochrome c family protein
MRLRLLILAAIAVIAMIVAVPAASAQEIQAAPMTLQQAALADGQALYAELCAVCHGADAKGGGPAAPALAAPAPDLTQLAMANGGEFPAAKVQKTIAGETRVVAHGTLEMPMWGKAFEDARPDRKSGDRWASAHLRILALTEYIESLQVEMQSE